MNSPFHSLKIRFFTSFITLCLFSHFTWANEHNKTFEKFLEKVTLVQEEVPEEKADFSNYLSTKNLSESERCYGNESILSFRSLLGSNEEIEKINQHLIKLSKHGQIPEELEEPEEGGDPQLPKMVSSITKEEAQHLLEILGKKEEIAKKGIPYLEYYKRGFCFGRATIAHCEAVKRGVDPRSIRKIWVAGDMGQWGFHVATAIKGDHGDWYIIDNFTEHVSGKMTTSVEEWIKIMETQAKNKTKSLRNLYLMTDASRFSGLANRPYNTLDLFNNDKKPDYYLGYFKNYFSHLAQEEEPTPFQGKKNEAN